MMPSYSNTLIITKKELSSYFLSPLIYIIAALFSLLMGWLFFNYVVQARHLTTTSLISTVLMPISGNINFLFLFIAPLTTMSMFTDEKKNNTLNLLFSSKITDLEIILGKLSAAIIVNLFLLSITLIFPILVSFSGTIDWGIVSTSYIGLILSITCYCTVGIFASSISKNQIIAALISFFILFGLMLLALASNATENTLVATLIQNIGITFHFQHMARGALRSNDIIYFLSFSLFFIFTTQKSLDSRNW